MDRTTVDWTGYIPAITTPFTRKGQLDLDSFAAQMDWLVAERMHGVILAGTSGEWFSLTSAERAELFMAGARYRQTGLTVIGACNAFTTAEAIAHARAAETAGLDGILLTPPPYVVPNRAEIVQFYRRVSDATDIPMTVYNWPRGCVVDMDPDLLDELADIENVVAIKNSTGDFAGFLDAMYRVEGRVRYFGLPTSALGVDLALLGHSDGLMGSGGVLGADHPDFWRAIAEGDRARAIQLGARDRVIMQAWFRPDYGVQFGNQQAIMKTALRLRGVPAGFVRDPLLELSGPEVQRIADTLHSLGIETRAALMGARYDAVVIGGGLLGCVTAWMIARDGGRVLLVERDQINQHASGRNAGSLHFQLEYRMIDRGIEAARQAAEAMPLHLEAARLWSALPALCGEAIEVKQTGGLMIAEDATQVELLEQKAEIERSWGLDNRVIDRAEVDRIAPYLSDKVIAAAYCPLEGKADARTAAPALARAALRLGAEIRTRRAVVGLSRQGGRWQVQLQGEDAETVTAEAVVIAAGVWTTGVGQMMGAHLPTIPLALTMTVTMRIPKLIPHLVQHAGGKLSLKQALDGNILIGGGWPARLPLLPDGQPDLDTKPDLLQASLAGNAAMAIRVLPELAAVPVIRSWVGTTTITPDQLPLVGPVPGHPGAFVATGGSAFTLGPCFAQVLADLIAGRGASMDLTKFDAARYGRG